MCMRRTARTAGVTVLELLVVVAILALLAGISAGAMRQFSNLRVLDAAKADVTGLLV